MALTFSAAMAVTKSPTWDAVPAHIREALEATRGTLNFYKSRAPAQQIVVGWASVAEWGDGTPVEDHEGDIIPLPELGKALDAFMAKPERPLGVHHWRTADDRPVQAGEVIEGFMVTPVVKVALGLDPATPHGAMIAAKVTEPLVWAAVEKGLYRMFSIHGTAERVVLGKGQRTLWARLTGRR